MFEDTLVGSRGLTYPIWEVPLLMQALEYMLPRLCLVYQLYSWPAEVSYH